MTPETLQHYAPCLKHRLWHDVDEECFYCLVEKAGAGGRDAIQDSEFNGRKDLDERNKSL